MLAALLGVRGLKRGHLFHRCELIPQTTENLGQGNLFYHFSLMRDDTSPPDVSGPQSSGSDQC